MVDKILLYKKIPVFYILGKKKEKSYLVMKASVIEETFSQLLTETIILFKSLYKVIILSMSGTSQLEQKYAMESAVCIKNSKWKKLKLMGKINSI